MSASSILNLHNALELTREDTFLDGGIECLVKTGKPATGQVSIYFESGALDFRYNLYNGRKHGLYEEFFENGDLKYWCHFRHGQKDFYDETYDKYGRLIQSDGWHQGLRHGRCESYELGQLSAIQEFKNGKRHGVHHVHGGLRHGMQTCSWQHKRSQVNPKRASLLAAAPRSPQLSEKEETRSREPRPPRRPASRVERSCVLELV